MNFTALQKTVRDLIAAHASFSAKPEVIFKDSGNKRSAIEAALDISSTPAGPGYAVMVWPPARGHSDSEQAGINGVDAMVVVRFEVNPKFLATLPGLNPAQDPEEWLNTRVANIVAAVLSAPAEVGGVKFQLAADAFELVNFDEGLIAYHLRFARFAVFGNTIT
jgi:hypothetical protein